MNEEFVLALVKLFLYLAFTLFIVGLLLLMLGDYLPAIACALLGHLSFKLAH